MFKNIRLETYYVYTFEDLQNIENLENVPYKIIIMNDIKGKSMELEERIARIDSYLDEYRNARKKYLRTGKDSQKTKSELLLRLIERQYKDIKDTFSLAPDIDFENYLLIDEIKETLYDLNEKVSYKFKPINLDNRTEQLLIVGRNNKISNLEIYGVNNVALFTNVHCDITINDLEFSKIKVDGVSNVSLLINGQGEKNDITLSDVGIHGTVNGKENVSELINGINGKLSLNAVEYTITVNDEEEKRAIRSEKVLLDGNYLNTRNIEIEDKEYVRVHKKH